MIKIIHIVTSWYIYTIIRALAKRYYKREEKYIKGENHHDSKENTEDAKLSKKSKIY